MAPFLPNCMYLGISPPHDNRPFRISSINSNSITPTNPSGLDHSLDRVRWSRSKDVPQRIVTCLTSPTLGDATPGHGPIRRAPYQSPKPTHSAFPGTRGTTLQAEVKSKNRHPELGGKQCPR